MGEAFIVRSGTGSPLSINAAVIHVNAPSGSSVKFSKGGIDVKTMTPLYGHANSDGSTIDYYYIVYPGSYGTWTVTAYTSSNTTSSTVAVSTNRQYDVKLLFGYYFYRNGTAWSGLTAYKYYGGGDASFTNNGTNLITDAKYTSGSNNAKHYFGSNNPVSIFHRKTIKIVIDKVVRTGSPGAGTIGLMPEKPTNYDEYVWFASTNLSVSSTQTTYTVDISAYGVVDSSYYIAILTSVGAGQELWHYIREWVIL